MTDPIADMLTRVRNANMVRHEKLELPASNIKKQIAEILKNESSTYSTFLMKPSFFKISAICFLIFDAGNSNFS
jgi:hypothetical protein